MSFYTVYEVLMANTWGWFAFPPPVDHILSELWQKTMTHPSWVSLNAWLSFIDLCKPLCQDKAVICEGLTKVCIVKVMVFPVVTYGCESWATKKEECQRIDAFELWCWRRLLRVPWIARRSNQSILKEITPEYSLEGLMLKLQYFGHQM